MGMWLQHLEFAECLTDSPYFREKLNSHEKELERTSQQIKGLVKEVKELIQAARQLSRAQRTLSETLKNFDFKCIGNGQTDEEVCIQRSLLEFGRLISSIEDQRDMMLDNAYEQIIIPLENFRKDCIGGAKEGKKRFDKQTSKFYMNQERYLNLSTKQKNNALKEADSALQMEERHFFQASLEYVLLLQEVQERKKFEFVETLMGFMYSWLTFYHQGHEVANEFKPYLKDLQHKIQKTRENFLSTRDQASQLMKKKLESHDQKMESGASNKNCTREGYLFLMEKKAFGTTWTKHYCTYHKETKVLTMIPYNQITNKFNKEETIKLTSCVRRMSDSIEKRFCFDITFENENKSGSVTLTLQALSEEDRKRWMDIMDGKEPVSLDETNPPTNSHANGTYAQPGKVNRPEETTLDEIGLSFFHKCIEILETRGLEEQGLYRVGGVTSKVSKLLAMGLDRRKTISPGGVTSDYVWDDPQEWDSKTVTSALKTFLRNLREPLMTFRLHASFIAAVKQESRDRRVNDVHILVYRLPVQHRSVLETLGRHLYNVASKSDKNLMTVSNLAVCFGPTLLRPEEETVAAIMDIKFCNIVVEIIIENHDKIFKNPPVTETSSPAHLSIGSLHNHSHSTSSSSPSSSMSLTQSGQQHAQPQQPSPLNSNNVIVPPPRHIKSSAYYSSYNMHSNPPPPPQPVQQAVIHSFYNGPSTVLNVGPLNPNRRPNLSPRSMASNLPSNIQQHPKEFLQHARSHPILGQGTLPSTGISSGLIRNTPHQTGIHSEETLLSSRTANKHAKPVFMHGTSLQYDGISDQLNNTSSSNESVCSLNSSREYSYPQPQSPQKNKRGNSIHYASQYKPAESLLCYAVSSPISGRSSPASPGIRRVRTLYTCKGENDGELSFEPNQIITNVRRSLEPGWLEGTLNGKTGLVPENYVQFLP